MAEPNSRNQLWKYPPYKPWTEPADDLNPIFDADGKIRNDLLPADGTDSGDVAKTFSNMAAAVADTTLGSYNGRFVLIAGPQGGLFTVDAAASGTADGGIRIDVNGGAQQITRSYEGPVRPEWWGVTGDGTTDDTVALQACFDSAAAIARGVEIRDGMVIRVTDTVTFTGFFLRMDGDARLQYAGPRDRSVIRVGGAVNVYHNFADITLSVRSSTVDWSDTDFVLADCRNLYRSQLHIKELSGGYIGLRCMGWGAGFGHTKTDIGMVRDCRIGVQCTNLSGSSAGWCNENQFIGGDVSCAGGLNTSISRTGWQITSNDNGYLGNNNNTWIAPCFQLNAHALSGGAEARPMEVVHGRGNRCVTARCEAGATVAGLTASNASAENVFSVGRSTGTDDTTAFVVQGDSTGGLNRTECEFAPVEALEFNSGFLPLKTSWYSSTTKSLVGHSWSVSGSGSRLIQSGTGVSVGADYVEIPNGQMIVARFYIENIGRVQVDARLKSGNLGRVALSLYDGAGVSVATPSAIPAGANDEAVYQSAFGGRYSTTSDNSRLKHFTLPDGVSFVEVMLGGGSAAMRVSSYTVRFFPILPGVQTVVEKVPQHGHRHETVALATADPATLSSSQTHALGDTIYNVAPSASGTIGWVCTTAGTPGTWKAFGTIAS